MAQDISLMGASYSDVPAVELPKTGGGTATFTDVTDTTAGVGDVASGEYFYTSAGVRSLGTGKYASAPAANGNADRANAILYGTVDGTSTATAFTATVSGLTQLVDGTCVMLHNGVITSASGFTVNVNGLGAKKCYNNMTNATQDTTIFNVAYTMLFVYSSALDSGAGGWWIYRGYDANTNTIGYQLRTGSCTLPASDKGYKYRLWFTSADGTKYVPANTSTSTNATSSRSANTRPINPFGPIVYNSANATTNAGANLGTSGLWQQYTLTLGYSFNNTGAALVLTYPAPVYLRCTPQANGSAVMDYFVQALPSTNDGKIYIFLGFAYAATTIELVAYHPVYYHDGTALRLWTGAADSGGGGATWSDCKSSFSFTVWDSNIKWQAITDGTMVYLHVDARDADDGLEGAINILNPDFDTHGFGIVGNQGATTWSAYIDMGQIHYPSGYSFLTIYWQAGVW